MAAVPQVVHQGGGVEQGLEGGVQIAGVAHVEHPGTRASLTGPVANLHLVSPEQGQPRLWDLVQLDRAAADRLLCDVSVLGPGEDDVLLLLLLRQIGALSFSVIIDNLLYLINKQQSLTPDLGRIDGY